jgi:predicted transcriptional regulator
MEKTIQSWRHDVVTLITLSARTSTIGGANMFGSGFGFVHGDTLRKIACCI